MKTSNTERSNLKRKCAEMNKYNSILPSSNCTREDGVCSKRRARSISPECKAKNPCKSSLDYIYGCNFCGLKFSGMETLQCHMPCVASVTSKDPLKCGACCKTFRESIDLEKHLHGLRTNKLFKCEICSKNCVSKSCLVSHMQIHVDIRSEKCNNQSETFLSREAKLCQKSSECTICNKRFLSKLCLQSHMKQHKEIETESHSRVTVENSGIPEKSSNSQEPMNRSFQDALNIRNLFTADFVNKHTQYQEQNSRKHCERERSSRSIFDQDRLFCDPGSSLPLDLAQKKISREQSRSSLSIFDLDTSSKIATSQNESTGLSCAQEISSKIKKTYRPYCVKCWATFEDLQALEKHAKFCSESCRESSPRKLTPISINQCIIAKSDDQCQSSECVMENGSEGVAVKSVDDVTENGSADVAENNSFEVPKVGSGVMATNKLHGGIDEEAHDGSDEVGNSDSLDWAKNSSDGLPRREPDDLASMIHLLAKNAADDLDNSESDDLAESFSEELANTESYLAKGGSDFVAMNGSEEVANFVSDDLAENGSDDVGKNGSDVSVENGSRRVTGVLGNVTKNGSCKLISSGSHQFIKSGLTDSSKSRSDDVTKYSILGLQFRCPECEEGFEISQQFKEHMSEVHSIEQPFMCKRCGKKYEKFCYWNRHVQAHRTDRRYVCNKCGKSFKFLHHLKSGHLPCLSGATELKCSKCNLEFVKASQLHNHLTLCQSEQAVQCQVCSRLFNNQSSLDKHIRCHTDEKPYQCSQCDKCFSFREGLISHVHRHSAIKPYVCDVCGKAFAVKAFLQSHLRIHRIYWKKCSLGSKIHSASNRVQMKEKEKRLPKRFYGCAFCGSLFMALISLKRHLPCEGGAGEKDPLFCGECTEKFCEENELEKHIASVHSENLFSCSVCNKMFVKELYLKKHFMHSHTGDRPYKCKQCSKGFKHAHHLKYHLPCYVSPGSEIQCNQCQMTFYQITQLRTHINIDHSSKALQCDVCGKKFVGRQSLDIHLKRHIEDRKKPYSCAHCTKCFVHSGSLKRHLDVHLKSNAKERKKPYSCTHCTKCFFYKSSLKRHLESVFLDPLKLDVENKNVDSNFQYDAYLKSQISPITAESSDPLYCLNCHKTFSSHQQLKKHMELHKQFGSSLNCSLCNHKFSRPDTLREHNCRAYSILGPQFRCPECEEGFEISWQLRKHMTEVHSFDQTFKCKHCSKQFEKFWLWSYHVQAHRTDRRYVCNKCGKRFKFLHHLKSGHLPCLSDVAELKCPKCNQEFVKASQLRNHLTLCQNERAVQCQVCGRLFLNQSILEKHMRCHTGEKPYQCSQCVKCFSFRQGLISHVHRHSAVKPYVCDVCGKGFAVKAFLRSHLRIHTTYWKKCSLGSKTYVASNHVQMKEKEKRLPKRFYGCGFCGSLFMAMISLKRHLPCEGDFCEKEPLFCGECTEEFCEENELEKHVGSVHSENLFSCSICNKMFAKKSRLKLHMRSHTGERPYKCKQCSKGFKHAHHLKKHLPCYVNRRSEIQCNQCQMTFNRIIQLRTHLIIDHSNKAVQCDVCGKKFVSRHALDIHVKRHLEDSKKLYSCMRCTKCFVKSSSLKHHLETVHLDPLKFNVKNKNVDSKFQYDGYLKSQISPTTAGRDDALYCVNCCKTFSSHEQLNKHMELHKRFGSSLCCSHCNQKFSLLDSLQEHICQAYSILGLQFRCPECEEGFEISRQLKKHMSEVHSIEHPFMCKRCGKKYETFCQWNRHVQAHRTDRRYVCNKCGKKFKFLHHLKSCHLPCLSDAAELKCPKCNQEFIKASQLRHHLTLCQNERAVKCHRCHRLFSNQSTLDKHMRCHTGEKPYQCSQCDKCFSFRQGLIIHVHRHSAVKPYVCDVCGKAFAVKAFLQSHLRIHTTYWKKCSVRSKVNGASNHAQMKEKEKRMPKRFYGCGLCGSVYMAMISLKRHLPCEEGGAGEKDPLFCGECTEKFCEENELEKHIVSVHSENLFSCSLCNKMFVKELYLKKHFMHSHSGDRPYKCKQCSKGFKRAHHLKYHLPCYVSPGSEIQCNQCQMKFDKITQLRTHITVDHSSKAVQCDVCGKKFVGRSTLDIHLKRHVEDSKKPYSCMRCSKCFINSSSLKHHLETVHLDPLKFDVENKNIDSKFLKSQIFPITAASSDALYCLNCHKSFSSHQQLNKHMELHKRFGSSLHCSRCNQKFSLLDLLQEHTCQAYSMLGPQFRCPECEEGFELSQQLKKHMSEVHSIEQHFKCKHCGKQFEKFWLWSYHVQTHRTDRRYVCNKCGKRFKLLHHLKSRHLPCLFDAAELKCPKCDQEFVKVSQLRSHMTLCQNERAMKCQLCHRLFNNQSRLDHHMRCHTGKKPYQCSQCDKCFSVREGLISHVHRHSAEKPYVCDVCGKAFAAEAFLRFHLRIHTSDRPYKCSECDMSFVYACYLRYHKAKVHRGVKKRFACSLCNKTFCSKMYLNTHMFSHTGQNPYLCSFCGKGFPAKSQLKYHVRVHTGEKPYACQYCYMRFSMPRSMRNHERVHTGEKPYECTICGMKFPQSSYLKNHSKKVHKVE